MNPPYVKNPKDGKPYCQWVVRDGINDTYWAYTPCLKGFNYLSKAKVIEHIKPHYEGRRCPICHRPILIDLHLYEE